MLKQITYATYILIILHFLRLAVNKLQAGKIHGAIKVDRWKYPYYAMLPYRIGNTLRAIVVYYHDIKGYGSISSAARLAFPSMFYGVTIVGVSNLTPEEYFKFSTNPELFHGDDTYNSYIDDYLTAAEAKNIIESIKHNSGIDTVTVDIILVSSYQPSRPTLPAIKTDFHMPTAGEELYQMLSSNTNSIRYAADAPISDLELLSVDGRIHFH